MPRIPLNLTVGLFFVLTLTVSTGSLALKPLSNTQKTSPVSGYQKTVDTYSRLLDRQIARLGKNHPQIARTYEKLGIAYYKLEQYNKALKAHKAALKILKKIDKDSERIAYLYNNLALVYIEKGRHLTALRYLKKALKFDLRKFGDTHPHLGVIYNSYGLAYKRKGKIAEAKKFYRKSIKLLKNGKDIDSYTSLSDSYYNLGILYLEHRGYSKAISYFKKALYLDIKNLGSFHVNIAEDYNNIGIAYRKKRNLAKARKYFNLAADTVYHLGGKSHPMYAKYVRNLNRVVDRQARRYLRKVRKHIVARIDTGKTGSGGEKVNCILKINQDEKGMILKARVRCNPNYKSSRHAIARAVAKSSPLPLPRASKIFNRNITLRIRMYK